VVLRTPTTTPAAPPAVAPAVAPATTTRTAVLLASSSTPCSSVPSLLLALLPSSGKVEDVDMLNFGREW